MEFSKQLDILHKGFMKGVRATLRYQFNDIGVKVSRDEENNAVRKILKAEGFSDESADFWISDEKSL